MANIDFPPGAINGTTHTQNGKTWVYDGTTWSMAVSTVPDASTIASGLVNFTTQTFGGNKSLANNLDIDGGLGVTGVAIFRSTLSILSNTNSTSSTSGALQIIGGVGVSGILTAGSGVSIGGLLRAGSGISVLGNITATGSLVLGSALATTSGGTGLNSIGTGNQVLGVNSGVSGLEYKTIAGGSGIQVNHTANNIEIVALAGGSGTVNAGIGGSVAYYAANGSAVSGTPNLSYSDTVVRI